ncbi:MAG: ArsR/SmtB family transcription factor [Acidimicrobiales bacterium]
MPVAPPRVEERHDPDHQVGSETASSTPVNATTNVLSLRMCRQLDELATSMGRAFNHSYRLMLLYALRDGPQTVGDLSRMLETSQSNTSRHLAMLRDQGLVGTKRRGNTVLYSLRHPRVLDAVDILRDVMSVEAERLQDLHTG